MRDYSPKQAKTEIKKRAKALIPNITYAMGCRGHPGLVIKRKYGHNWSLRDLYGADVVIKSLVDGVEESCSLFYCNPQPISKKEAEERAYCIKTMHDVDIALQEGYSIDETIEWVSDWKSQGVDYYVIHEQEQNIVRSTSAFTLNDAEKEVERLNKFTSSGISNVKIVDLWTYPSPIQSPEIRRIVYM